MDTENQNLQTVEKNARATVFGRLFLPSLIFACIYAALLYHNYSSITMPLFVLATLGYCYHVTKQMGNPLSKASLPYAVGMLLLGISTCLTDSLPLQVLNFMGILLLLICMLLAHYFNIKNWTLAKHLQAFVLTFAGAIGCIGDFFTDLSCYRKEHKSMRNRKVGYVLLGIGISIPFLLVVILLLCSADAVFADFVRSAFDFDFAFGNVFGIAFTILFVLFASYCGIRFLGLKRISEKVPDLRRLEPILANTILTLTAIVYLFFSGIQIVYLFMGNMTLPDGYTYAAYAREGFFQLLFVSMMNLAMVLFFLGCFKEHKLLKVLLTIISACTYVMLASSALRMCMYIRAYHLTFLRVFVLWFLALLAVLLAGIVIQIYKRTFPLFRYMLLLTTCFYIGLSFGHPDYWIAKYNVTHIDSPKLGEMGEEYLQYLSADAAPAIADCGQLWVMDYKENILDDYESSPRKFNFSTWNAKRLLEK